MHGSGAASHTIVHQVAPTRWHEGLPLGNGTLGAMLWGDGGPLCLTLDRADLWDLRGNDAYQSDPDYSYEGLLRLAAAGRFDEAREVFEARHLRDNPIGPTKISIGRAELNLGEATRYQCILNLGTATARGTMTTAAGQHQIVAFVCHGRNTICLRADGPVAGSPLTLKPLAEMNDSLSELGHPPPDLSSDGDVQVLCQTIPDGISYAVAWNTTGPDYYIAIETAASAEEAREASVATWRLAAEAGLDRLHEEHVAAWGEFWQRSAVYLPEERIEFLWYFGLYLLASAARRGQLPPGLQGVWAMDGVLPPWRGEYAMNMNVQETFWPALASGHLELMDCWCDFMLQCLPRAREFTQRFFGTEGSFWPGELAPGFVLIWGWYTVLYAWSHSGWLAWMVWQRWRYSMDRTWLEQTGYPLVAEVFRFYSANLRPGEDGYLHVPLSASTEYGCNTPDAWAPDPNLDLALIRRCCDWVTEMEAALGIAVLTPQARDVRARLAPYALTEDRVLCLWPGKPLDISYHHPSQLMAIHPAMDLTIEGDDGDRATISASLEQYLSLGRWGWGGHTYAQMASLGAVVGRAEFAYDCLHQFAEYWIGPNALHLNRDLRCTGMTQFCGDDIAFTMEASCGVAAGVNDMLLQGWNDTVRVFPAVPAHWRDIAFRELVTEGAFTVSAIRRNGRTASVIVRATVARRLRLRDPFAGADVSMSGAALVREGDCFVGPMNAGEEVVLCLEGDTCDIDAAVATVRASDTSRLGLRA
ncbi:MAG TPA: hypothetical protein DGT21_18270 [Armatimonadetes bacterium]|nr:hypothetical protein [Armatimonadota bacterium]